MIEITLKEIMQSTDLFNKLLDKECKAKVAYWIAKLVTEINKEYTIFNDTRKKLIEKYGKRDEEGNLITINDNFELQEEYIQEFNEQINELLNETVELNINPIDINDLEEFKFKPNEMALLMPFVKK